MTLLSREHMYFEKDALIPIVRWPHIDDHFVDPTLANCYSVMLGDQLVMTAPLQIGSTINLLEAAQPTWQVGEEITDWVAEGFKIARLYLRITHRTSEQTVVLDTLEDVTHSRCVHSSVVEFGYTNHKRVDRYGVGIRLTGWLNRQTGEVKLTGGCDYRTMDVGIEVIGYTLAANRASQ